MNLDSEDVPCKDESSSFVRVRRNKWNWKFESEVIMIHTCRHSDRDKGYVQVRGEELVAL